MKSLGIGMRRPNISLTGEKIGGGGGGVCLFWGFGFCWGVVRIRASRQQMLSRIPRQGRKAITLCRGSDKLDRPPKPNKKKKKKSPQNCPPNKLKGRHCKKKKKGKARSFVLQEETCLSNAKSGTYPESKNARN